MKYLHATINGKPALWSYETDELAVLPPNVRRVKDDTNGHPVEVSDSLGRPLLLNWVPQLKTDAVKIFYTIKKVYHEWREEDKFKIHV